MLSRLAVLAVATPTPGGSGDSGPANLCCQQTATAGSAAGAGILALIGVVVQDVTAKIGLDCSPISAVGVGSGNACQASPVCCQNNNDVRSSCGWSAWDRF